MDQVRASIDWNCQGDFAFSDSALFADESRAKVSVRGVWRFTFWRYLVYAQAAEQLSPECGFEVVSQLRQS